MAHSLQMPETVQLLQLSMVQNSTQAPSLTVYSLTHSVQTELLQAMQLSIPQLLLMHSLVTEL